MSKPELAAVTQAAADVKASRTKYREALLAAHEYGYSYSEIARAAGVSRQAIFQAFRDFTPLLDPPSQ